MLTVKIVDQELRNAFKRMESEMKGRRNWKEMSKFTKYKKSIIHEPWAKRGIDENNRPGAWKINTVSTAKRKAKQHLGIKRMKSSEVTYYHRIRWLMRDSGTLYDAVRVGFSKKKCEFAISAGRAGSKYAYMHLYGKPGMFPPRPWGVWTTQNMNYLAGLLAKWGSNLGRRVA